MIVKAIRTSRSFLHRHSRLKKAFNRAGINKLGRRAYEKWPLKSKAKEITLLGQRLRFSISSLRELERIETMSLEEPFIRRMLETLQPDDVVFDVGANIGMISLLLANGGTKLRAIHAFEPEPGNAAALGRNVSLNSLENVISVHELALGEAEGKATLHVVWGDIGAGRHSLMANDKCDQAVSIDLTTTAAFAASREIIPDLVKIDVEGAEMQVLGGMEPLLVDHSIREIFIEVHPGRMGEGADEISVEKWLRERGYRRVWSEKRQSEFHQHYSRIETEC